MHLHRLYFFCSFRSKNELGTEEFLFFLTGGIGLENKVYILYDVHQRIILQGE